MLSIKPPLKPPSLLSFFCFPLRLIPASFQAVRHDATNVWGDVWGELGFNSIYSFQTVSYRSFWTHMDSQPLRFDVYRSRHRESQSDCDESDLDSLTVPENPKKPPQLLKYMGGKYLDLVIIRPRASRNFLSDCQGKSGCNGQAVSHR